MNHTLEIATKKEKVDVWLINCSNGAGRIRTDDLQRPRLASYQARRQPLICLFQN